MFENWYEEMTMVKMRNESVFNDIHNIRIKDKLNRRKPSGFSRLKNNMLDQLGVRFSHLGDSLQSHYHNEMGNHSKSMKKVS